MLLSLITSFILAFFHPLHLSVLEIRHNASNNALEMSQRVFIDDFEDTLRKRSGLAIDVINPRNPAQLDQLIAAYLKEKVQLQVNGKPVTFTVIGHEREEDAIWIYAEASGVKRVKELNVLSTVFLDQFSDQVNFVHFTDAEGEQTSQRLSADKPQGSFY